MANLSHFFLIYVLLYREIGDAQVIIAKHDNCRHDLYKNDNLLKSSNSISSSQENIFENFDSKSLVEKWCILRALSGEALSKCTNSLSRLCGDENQTAKNVNETCPFLTRTKRQTDGRTEKVSKEDMAKLKQGFAKLATDFFANLLKNAGKPGGQMGDVPMMSDTPRYSGAVNNNELQQNNPDNYLSGDMDVSKNQADHFFDILQQGAVALFSNAINKWASSPGSRRFSRKKRKVGKEPAYHLWTSMPIPYQFNKNVDPYMRQIITNALQLWQSNTCVRWAKDIVGIDRIEFINGDGCSSFVGKTGGTQEISLKNPGCDSVGISSHEIGHSLGFFHEQGRPDQVSNVQVNYANVLASRKDNFVPMPLKDVNTYNLPYEYGSVMHYDGFTRGFTYNPNKYSISTKDAKFQNTIGQRVGPSFIDFKLINMAYCGQICQRKLGCQHSGYEDPNSCMQCKCPGGFGGRLCESAAPSSPGCGGVIKATKEPQYISSPGYPGQYSKGLQCNWYILAPPGGRIYLTFGGTFSFPCDEICTNSYVEVKPFQDFQRTGYRFCCNKAPDQIVAESNEMIIIFVSNGQVGNGFRAAVSTDSTGVIVAPTAPPPIQITQAPVTVPAGQTPKSPQVQGCDCDDWGPWSQCTQPCGGCGYVSRSRRCNRNNCYNQEKKHCNFVQCPSGTNVLINNGQFDLLFNGCCVGSFPADGQCGGLSNAVSQFFTGLIANSSGKK